MPVDSNNVAKVAILHDEKILVLHRSDNKKKDLPGGHLHIGENEIVGIIREVYEETKLTLLSLDKIISYKNKVLFESNNFDGVIELDLKENYKYEWMEVDSFLDIDSSESTDVIVAYQAYLLEDPKFWKNLRVK
jgi:8-oxo-dGTP pyrophosphatase MutT (NUDIX family)